MDLIAIGRVIKAHGLDGTLEVFPVTDFPQHFKSLKELFLVKEGITRTGVEKAQFHKGHVLLKVALCTERGMAEKWIGAEVAIKSTDLWPLGEDEYYHFQIQGLSVVTEEGEYLGVIEEIITTGSNDVYVVRNKGTECLLPSTKEVIKQIDLERKVMTVHLIEGLRE